MNVTPFAFFKLPREIKDLVFALFWNHNLSVLWT